MTNERCLRTLLNFGSLIVHELLLKIKLLRFACYSLKLERLGVDNKTFKKMEYDVFKDALLVVIDFFARIKECAKC